MGGSGRDESRGITIDSNNDVILVGGTTSFIGPGFLVKYSSSGYEKWNKTGVKCDGFAGNYHRSNGLVIDSLDNIYIASGDQYILKYSSSGLKIWEKSWGSDISYYDIDLDSSNNLYVSGAYDSSGPAGLRDIIFVKFNNQGDYQWHRAWGGGQDDYNWGGIKIDDSDYIYLTGCTWSYGAGSVDLVIIKYDNNGNQIWNKTWGNEWYNVGYDIFIDSSFNIFIVGGSSNSFLLIKYYQTKPKSFALDSTADNPDKDGSFELNWEQSDEAVNYSIYQHNHPITDINQSILFQEGITELSLSVSGLIDGIYYYILVAFNKYGNISSNSIFINVDRMPDSPYNSNPPDGSNEIDLNIILNVDVSHPSEVLMDVSFYDASNDNLIGIDIGVFSEETASISWFGLSEGTTYQWYVIVSDGMDIVISSIWTFTTLDIPSWVQVPIDQVIEYGEPFNYNINATDISGIDHYWINDTTNFQINGNGIITNITILDVSIYWLEVRAYDPYDHYCLATFKIVVQDTDIPEPKPDLPSLFMLNSNVNTTNTGIFLLYWTISEYANNYSLYQNNILLDSGLIELYYSMEIYSNGSYNFKVIAFNDIGNTTSNEITVNVEISPTPIDPEPEPEPEPKSKIIGINPIISVIFVMSGIIGLLVYMKRKTN